MLSEIEKSLLNELYVLSGINGDISQMPHIYKVSDNGKEWLSVEIRMIEGYFRNEGLMDNEGCFLVNDKGNIVAEYWDLLSESWLSDDSKEDKIIKELESEIWGKLKSL